MLCCLYFALVIGYFKAILFVGIRMALVVDFILSVNLCSREPNRLQKYSS